MIKGVIGITITEQNNKVILNFKETIKLAYFLESLTPVQVFFAAPYLQQEGAEGDIVFSESKDDLTKYIYIESTTSVCPIAGIGTLPPPLSPAIVPLPPEPRGRGGTLACG